MNTTKTDPSKQTAKATPKTKTKGGKRALYDPALGTRNLDLARTGPRGKHPAYQAMRLIAGAKTGLQRMAEMTNAKTLKTVAPAVAAQMERGLEALRVLATALQSAGDKLRFAEAVAAFFETKQPDVKTERALWTSIEMRTRPTLKGEQMLRGQTPTQAELRAELKRRHPEMTFSNKQWGRMLASTGLDKKLPSANEKAARETG